MSDSHIINRENINKLLKNSYTTYESLEKQYNIITTDMKNEVEKDILKLVLDKDRFIRSIPIDKFCLYLNILNSLLKTTENSDEINKTVMEIIEQTDDPLQINTLKYCIMNSSDINSVNWSSNLLVTKRCPHCGINNKYYDGTCYVICGYVDNEEYDWKGCGSDWCFSCGKKLCKKWSTHELYLKINRFHDNKCCKKHAKHNSFNYKKDYCFCHNFNVKR